MRHAFVALLVLLALSAPAPAHAGGAVTVCDEPHLLAALADGGMVTFACSGTITLTKTVTIANHTTTDGAGQNIIISGNNAVGIFRVNSGTELDLNQVTLADASTVGDGGGIYAMGGGTVNVADSTFSGNSAGGDGGGIYALGGTVIVSRSAFSDNQAGVGGGAINNHEGKATITGCRFDRNSADSLGGAIRVENGTVSVTNSTFSRNRAQYGGGISKDQGTLTVANSTFSANGAAVFGAHYGSISITNCTLVEGGIANYAGLLTLGNTIVANSLAGGNCAGTIVDGGGNLSYPDATCPGINADPKLGRLKDNGGPTWTMGLLPGSAAIDAADDAICAAEPVNSLDQRGIVRPQGSHCDIGAFEALQPGIHVYLPVILR